VARDNVVLTADTSQAQQAMTALKSGWINAAAGMVVVEKMFNTVAGAAEKVNQAIRDQAQFFSATKDAIGLASVQMSTAATDGMIKPMTLAKGVNVLMRGDLKLTQNQMDAVAKAAVELGRATGEDVNAVFDRLSKGVLKGSTEAISEYGIQVKNTGSIQQKQAAMLSEIEKRYGAVSVAATDAGEVQDKYANQVKLQQMQAVKNLEGAAKAYSFLKAEAAEGFAAIGELFTDAPLTKASQARAQYNALLEQSFDTQKEINKLNMALLDPEINKAKNAAKRLELQKQYAAALSTQGQIENAIISYASKYNFTLTDIFRRRGLIENATKKQVVVEKQITQENEKQKKLLDEIARKKAETDRQVNALLAIAAENDAREKERRDAAISAYQQMMNATRSYLKQQEEAAAKSLDDQLAKFGAHQDAMNALKKQKADEAITQEQLGYAAELNRKAEQAKRVDDARAEIIMANAERERKIRKDAADKELEDRKEYIAKTKELVEGLSQVTLAAIFAEKKARDGLTKTEYVMKQLAAYMKGEALKYAAKSIGYLAEGVAATFWNPPAAAAAFKASALSAAAAAAFGGGSVAASAMAGKSSGSSSSSASSTTQREAVGGTAEQSRGTVNIVIGGRGVLFGNPDELARKLSEIMNSANRRGRI
jgi:hypothetical protein